MNQAWWLHILHYLGGGICHQLAERSLQCGGVALPLCARCTGTFLGALVGLVALVWRHPRSTRLPRLGILVLLGIFLITWAADGLNSYLWLFPAAPHLYEPSNTFRLVTGSLEGLALVTLIWPFVSATVWRFPLAEPVMQARELACILLTIGLIVALVLLNLPGILLATTLFSMAGLLSLLALVNALVLFVLLQRESTLEHRRQFLLYLAAGLLPTLIELLALSTLRHWLLPW